jgi:hypothetical protein
MITEILFSPFTLLAIPLFYYLIPWLLNTSQRSIPGPKAAAFSNLWLMYHCRRGRRYAAVHEAHQKYGRIVRIQPNHVSVVDTDGIYQIYAHGNGFLKSNYYDAFVSIRRGLFNTRDRSEHTRKRKIVSHTFSAKSIGQFERYMVRLNYFYHAINTYLISSTIISSYSSTVGQNSLTAPTVTMPISMLYTGSTISPLISLATWPLGRLLVCWKGVRMWLNPYLLIPANLSTCQQWK